MRYLASLIALPMAALAVPASAQVLDAVSQRLEMIGDAPAACVIGQPVATNAVNASFSVNSIASGTIGISDFVDLQTGETRASSIELTFPVTCNASHRVTLRSGNGGMLRAGSSASASNPGQGFLEFVTYQLQLGWDGQNLQLPSSDGGGAIPAARASTVELLLRVDTPDGSGPLVAGQYDDSIVIEFQASI